jgi:hypothetical protein
MTQGRVYLWTPDPHKDLGGMVSATVVPLLRLDEEDKGTVRLCGSYVRVKNGGVVNVPDLAMGGVKEVSIGDAEPDAEGNFIFEQGRGGGRMDKVMLADPDFRRRYIQASHFGEVNTYFHLDRIASYVDELLHELGSISLPRVTAVVNAHHAATEKEGLRDGVMGTNHWLPFQGGHYRLPGRLYVLKEYHPISPEGEIHLGPGWSLVEHGALVEAAKWRYRANASHNAGIIYHEYGHHITRHTADFRANAMLLPDQQNNRKTALDEGMADYWAATVLDTPHIWAWHHRHDEEYVHPRSLVSTKTMADFDAARNADPHVNGTIWAAALWDARTALTKKEPDGARRMDTIVLQALLIIGRLTGSKNPATVMSVRRARRDFPTGVTAVLEAEEKLFSGKYHNVLLESFAQRGMINLSKKVNL